MFEPLTRREKSPDLQGTFIEDYQLLRKLGEGATGAVYEARREGDPQRVAIKVLHAELTEYRDVVLRFLNESRAVKIVQHPGLCQALACGELSDGTIYLVMEFVEGQPLKSVLRAAGGRLTIGETLSVGRQVAEALTATHAKGIIHRDIKPDNIILARRSEAQSEFQVKILDFGIAKLRPEHLPDDVTLVRTNRGQLLGTPHFMAPEQCHQRSAQTDKVDVYSLGIVLYRCLTSRAPFVTKMHGEAGIMDLCSMHISMMPPPLRDFASHVSEGLSDLIHRMINKQPDDRPTMQEVATALAEQQERRGSSPDEGLQTLTESQMLSRPLSAQSLNSFGPTAPLGSPMGSVDVSTIERGGLIEKRPYWHYGLLLAGAVLAAILWFIN